MRDDTLGGPRGGPHDDTHTQSYREEQGRLEGDDAPVRDAADHTSLGSMIRGPLGSEPEPEPEEGTRPADAGRGADIDTDADARGSSR